MTRWLVLGAVLGSVFLGTGCVIKSTPRPDYDHCFSSSDCESGLCAMVNVRLTDGTSRSGYQCTRTCSMSTDCGSRNGYGGGCLMIAGTATGYYCYQGCATDFDCPGSGMCLPVVGGASGHACFPVN